MSQNNKEDKNSHRMFAGGPVVRTSQGGNSHPEEKKEQKTVAFPCSHTAKDNGQAVQHCPICTTITPPDAANTAGWHKIYVPVSTVQSISDTASHPSNPFVEEGSHRILAGVDLAKEDGDRSVICFTKDFKLLDMYDSGELLKKARLLQADMIQHIAEDDTDKSAIDAAFEVLFGFLGGDR